MGAPAWASCTAPCEGGSFYTAAVSRWAALCAAREETLLESGATKVKNIVTGGVEGAAGWGGAAIALGGGAALLGTLFCLGGGLARRLRRHRWGSGGAGGGAAARSGAGGGGGGGARGGRPGGRLSLWGGKWSKSANDLSAAGGAGVPLLPLAGGAALT